MVSMSVRNISAQTGNNNFFILIIELVGISISKVSLSILCSWLATGINSIQSVF